MSDFFETYMLFRRVIFTTRKKEKYLKKCPDQPYLEGPSARKTGFFFFFFFVAVWGKKE